MKKILFDTSHKIIPTYRVLQIEKSNENDFNVVVQVINKNLVFRMKPEEILSDDSLTDAFYPRDIRTLTYLGYLGINSPKYTILAKRFRENNKLVFTIEEKRSKKIIVKTPEEVTADREILSGLNQLDAHMVGFSTGSEQVLQEEMLMANALAAHQNKITSVTN